MNYRKLQDTQRISRENKNNLCSLGPRMTSTQYARLLTNNALKFKIEV